MSLDAKHGTSRGPFEPTRWSLVLRAGAEDTAQRNAALGELYGAYWSPLYAFLRRGGRTVDDARDLVQEFFVRLLDGSLLSAADPAKGRFRTLLLAGLRHLDANTHRAALAAKRGGGRELVPLDFVPAEERWQAEAEGGLIWWTVAGKGGRESDHAERTAETSPTDLRRSLQA